MNSTAQRAARPPDTDSSRTRDTRHPQASPSTRSVSLVAGLGLLAMTVLAVFANFIVVEGLITPGDAAATASDVMKSEGLFRLGLVAWFLVAALDVVVAWALFHVFEGVDHRISRLAGWLRLAYSGVLVIAITELVGGLRVLEGGPTLNAFSAEQLQAQALLQFAGFNDLYDAALILFGLHLAVLGYLAFRSGSIPRLVGVLLAIAGAGYFIDSMAAMLGQPTNVAMFTFMGEFILAVWLVARSRRPIVAFTSRDDLTAVAR